MFFTIHFHYLHCSCPVLYYLLHSEEVVVEEVFAVVIVVIDFVDLRVLGLIGFVVPELIVVVALIVVAEQQTVALW